VRLRVPLGARTARLSGSRRAILQRTTAGLSDPLRWVHPTQECSAQIRSWSDERVHHPCTQVRAETGVRGRELLHHAGQHRERHQEHAQRRTLGRQHDAYGVLRSNPSVEDGPSGSALHRTPSDNRNSKLGADVAGKADCLHALRLGGDQVPATGSLFPKPASEAR